jgi:hypothetical protein
VERDSSRGFNGRLQDECLNVERFPSLEDARQKLVEAGLTTFAIMCGSSISTEDIPAL